MKKIVVLITAVLFSALSFGQTAKQVLDKAAAAVSSKSGVTASFTMSSAQYGNTSGTISVKGRKFHASVPMATMWFDGKTQWTYMKKNNEVNVTTPTEAQLQAINPYNFINMYKKGFKYTMTSSQDVPFPIERISFIVSAKESLPELWRIKSWPGLVEKSQ